MVTIALTNAIGWKTMTKVISHTVLEFMCTRLDACHPTRVAYATRACRHRRRGRDEPELLGQHALRAAHVSGAVGSGADDGALGHASHSVHRFGLREPLRQPVHDRGRHGLRQSICAEEAVRVFLRPLVVAPPVPSTVYYWEARVSRSRRADLGIKVQAPVNWSEESTVVVKL